MSAARGDRALSFLPLLLSHGALNKGLLAELSQLMREEREESLNELCETLQQQSAELNTLKAELRAIKAELRALKANVSQLPSKRLWVKGHALTMTRCPAGSFLMGSDKGSPHDGPQHEVTFTRDFWISETLVTQELYATFMNTGAFEGAPTTPITGVSAYEAAELCNFLSVHFNLDPVYQLDVYGRSMSPQRNTSGFRLPSEAEWEYAAHLNHTHTSLNLQGMSDAVAQWCADSFMPYTYLPRVDPMICIPSAPQIVRGGTYQNGTPTLPTQRGALEGHKRHTSIGFRLAQSCL